MHDLDVKVKTAGPRLRTIRLLRDRVQDWSAYPFNLPVVRSFSKLELTSRVCFFVGENGSGKSTLLEGIAAHCGFGREGGSKHLQREIAVEQNASIEPLVEALRLSWTQKILTGFFYRAESFFNVATYLDQIDKENPGDGTLNPYGGRSLHEQSHGESARTLFENRFFGLVRNSDPRILNKDLDEFTLIFRAYSDSAPRGGKFQGV